jgi:hypothetical protein
MALLARKGVDFNGQRAVNAGDASAATDLITKQQLDAAIRGLDWKYEVIAASTGNINTASPGTTLDGVTLSAGMQVVPNIGTVTRILLKNQTTPGQNGIYDWTASGSALTRSVDADAWSELAGSTVTVQQGTVNQDRVYRASGDETGTLGTTDPNFVQIGAGGTAYTAGNGLLLTGSTFDVGVTAGLTVAADTVGIDTSIVSRIYQADCVVTTNPQSFTHGLGKRPCVHVIRLSDDVEVYPDKTVSTTTITIDWGAAPSAAEYRVIASG